MNGDRYDSLFYLASASILHPCFGLFGGVTSLDPLLIPLTHGMDSHDWAGVGFGTCGLGGIGTLLIRRLWFGKSQLKRLTGTGGKEESLASSSEPCKDTSYSPMKASSWASSSSGI